MPEEHNITVAALPTADLAGLYIAQDDGFFAQQHLHVTIERIASSAASIADQENGQVDVTAGSYVAYIAAQAAGARFRILAEALPCDQIRACWSYPRTLDQERHQPGR